MKRTIYTLAILASLVGSFFAFPQTVLAAPASGFPTCVLNTSATKGYAPLTVQFDAGQSSEAFSTPTWDFGDNIGRAISVTPTYTFNATGRFRVRLTVYGSGGLFSTCYVDITVISGTGINTFVPVVTATPVIGGNPNGGAGVGGPANGTGVVVNKVTTGDVTDSPITNVTGNKNLVIINNYPDFNPLPQNNPRLNFNAPRIAFWAHPIVWFLDGTIAFLTSINKSLKGQQ